MLYITTQHNGCVCVYNHEELISPEAKNVHIFSQQMEDGRKRIRKLHSHTHIQFLCIFN
jgi:hypothetical protein